jgi:hypothetical protein
MFLAQATVASRSNSAGVSDTVMVEWNVASPLNFTSAVPRFRTVMV